MKHGGLRDVTVIANTRVGLDFSNDHRHGTKVIPTLMPTHEAGPETESVLAHLDRWCAI
jgi:hypothetical protein